MSLAIEHILSIMDRDGEDELMLNLSSFSCAVNNEIQTFLYEHAIEFARKKDIDYIFGNRYGEWRIINCSIKLHR